MVLIVKGDEELPVFILNRLESFMEKVVAKLPNDTKWANVKSIQPWQLFSFICVSGRVR